MRTCDARLRATVTTMLLGLALVTGAPALGAALGLENVLGDAGAAGFARAERIRPFTFPADHGPHDRFRSEWWYLTATLENTAGDMFGEFSLLTGEPRSADVVARTECALFEITKNCLAPVLARNPDLAATLGRILASRQADQPAPGLPPTDGEDSDAATETGLLGRVRAFFGLAA